MSDKLINLIPLETLVMADRKKRAVSLAFKSEIVTILCIVGYSSAVD
jgi:hypothetical protein